jgi:NhaA family Na+:H+ antiporter
VTLEGLTSLLPLGIIAGLFIGKPLGISLFCWLALKLKWASLPEGPPASRLWRSAFCAGLALRCRFSSPRWPLAADPALINWAKLGILIGSVLSAVIGYLLRQRVTDSPPA